MSNKLFTNKYVLIGLGLVAIIGIIFISYNATQTSVPSPTPTPRAVHLGTAKMPTPVQDKPVTGQIIVKFKPQYTQAQINAHLQQYHASIIKQIEGINQTVVKVPAGQEDAISQKLKSDPYVETTQRDYTTHAFFAPNDQAFNVQYALNNTGQTIQGQKGTAGDDIHTEAAWDVTQGNGVKVAILDTGINLNHPDLAGKVVAQKSFVSNTVEDGNGHGTHVAGILAADTNNSIGVAGTCPGCQLIIGKVLDDTGTGTTSNATAGITWAADQGAKVINMSLGTTEPQTIPLYQQAVNYAMSKGAVVVSAAGNDGTTQFSYPAAVNGVISVAGTDNDNKKASWSDYGTWVDVAAPGQDIASTGPTHSFQLQPNNYNFSSPYYYLSGTSMSTPYVSGVAALIASTPYGTTPQAISNRLFATADKIAGTGTYWQYGLVDAAKAVGPAPTLTKAPQPTLITPTLYCVGGNAQPPCATIPPSGGVYSNPSSAVGGGGGSNPSVSTNPSGAPISASVSLPVSPSISGTPPIGGPNTSAPICTNLNQIINKLPSAQNVNGTKVHIKCHSGKGGGDNDNNPTPNSNNGWLSKFFTLLLKLLLQLLHLCTSQPNTGSPSISPSPSLSLSPGAPVSSNPSVNSPSPTVGGATKPTIGTASPAPSSAPSAAPSTNSMVPAGIPGSWKIIFDDEFNGTSLDTSKWAPYWFSNGANQNNTTMETSNVSVSGGTLNLAVTSSTGSIVSTNPTAGGHFDFTYGAVEARIYLPASGSQVANWPAWWTDGEGNWPATGEMDVMEGLGGSACYHFHSPSGGPGGCANGNFSGWHTYGAVWKAGSVTYYYDGKNVGTISSGITSAPMYLILENSHGGPTSVPATMKVDYVRVWQ